MSLNSTSTTDKMDILLNKIKHELDANRVAGPFDYVPIFNLQISPLGLVPKKANNEYIIIHHLSYPVG